MKLIFCLLMLLPGICIYGQQKKSSLRREYLTSLNKFKGKKAYFKSRQGHFFKIRFVPDTELPEVSAEAIDCSGNLFRGRDRKVCKTTIATAPLKLISFSAFLNSLVSDSIMIKNPLINKSPENHRVKEEKRNVQLKGIYLFAVKRESDNDYHLIVGNKSGSFLNVEISGLPPSSSPAFKTLKAARAKFDAYLGSPVCNKPGYTIIPKGLKINLTGSAFYDIDHPPGEVGPVGYKPATAWEIHPLTNISFLE